MTVANYFSKGQSLALFATPPPIGDVTPNTGAFSTLIATSLDSTPIGGSTPAAGAFTTLSAATILSLTTAAGGNSAGIRFNSGGTGAGNFQAWDNGSNTYLFFSANRNWTGSAWTSTGWFGSRPGLSLQIETGTALVAHSFAASSNTAVEFFRATQNEGGQFLRTAATTSAVSNVLTLGHNSTGTPVANFGTALLIVGESSTTESRSMARLRALWTTATDASRKARGIISAFDTAERDCLMWEASGSAAMLGFFGTAPVVKPTALTTQLTTITHTAPGTPDYALQDLTDTGGFGFATKDEGNTALSVIANLQTRVGELETKLQALGLLT